MPFMGGADYLGPELNGGTYRFKFMQTAGSSGSTSMRHRPHHPPLAPLKPRLIRARD